MYSKNQYQVQLFLLLLLSLITFFVSVGQLKRQYKWSDEDLKNWGGKTGIQQKIADKCRNLNKPSKKNL